VQIVRQTELLFRAPAGCANSLDIVNPATPKKTVARMLANGFRMPYNHKRTAFVGSLLPRGSCAMPNSVVTGERFDG
jgi:hypothetical protein